MITPPTKSFFVIHVAGEAADFITNKFSPEVTSDIREAVLISDDYETDIEAHHKMDDAINVVRKQLRRDKIKVSTETKHNPLYIPSTQEEIDSVLQSQEETETFKFVGFEGNPYTMKSVEITSGYTPLISARVACHEFDLPSYNDIVNDQQNKVLN